METSASVTTWEEAFHFARSGETEMKGILMLDCCFFTGNYSDVTPPVYSVGNGVAGGVCEGY